tara:strand:- start:790 stop:1383 length:594 start_codon:yes stop_codon:yes gene_type:complete
MSVWPFIDAPGRRIGYARVSTPDQRLDMQIDGLKAIGCVAIFSDHGVSGANATRPGLDGALEALQDGDVLVVFKLDRLGRSVLHLADLLSRFQRDGIHFCSLSEGINTTTPGGKLIYHVFSAVAEFQREIIVENTIEGLDAARRRGKRLGRPPLLNQHVTMEAHRQHCQKGMSTAELASQLNVSPSTLRRAYERFGL